VEVVVGTDKRTFYIHERLIRSQSAFFESALGKEWKEGQARKIELPDDDAHIFEAYARWLYSGKLAVNDGDEGGFEWWSPTNEAVEIIYKTTPRGSPARHLMVDMHTLKGDERWIDIGHPEKHNHDFTVDLAHALLKKRTVHSYFASEHEALDKGNPCSYHKHGKGEECDA